MASIYDFEREMVWVSRQGETFSLRWGLRGNVWHALVSVPANNEGDTKYDLTSSSKEELFEQVREIMEETFNTEAFSLSVGSY